MVLSRRWNRNRILPFAVVVTLSLLVPMPVWAQLELEVAYESLGFERPVDLQHAGDATGRLFVVEQAGVIRVFATGDDHQAGEETPTASVFLDLRDRVRRQGNEEGLLGLAFHPDFSDNGYLFVNYSASSPRRTVISRFRTEQSSGMADPATERVMLEFRQPFSNHNGGQLAFGPDGYLYIASGDGGSAGDPQGNGQNLATLLGKILRIDVDRDSDDMPYAIPDDNPFVGERTGEDSTAVREEIFALGLRNPWRFSFDPLTGLLWTGDVGQSAFEEVDLILSGGNYGWNAMEGTSCFTPPSGCDSTRFEAPVWEYGRDQGVSVTGGYVYRGRRVPELFGAYVYADWGSGRIWALRQDSQGVATNTELLDTDLNISAFGVDADQGLYICAFDGLIYRFKATATSTAIVQTSRALPDRLSLRQNFPNPFNASTSIGFDLPTAEFVALNIYNLAGQRLRSLSHGHRAAGTHRVSWDGRDDVGHEVATGTYVYRISTERNSEARKLLLLR